jgi:hypothetical protein
MPIGVFNRDLLLLAMIKAVCVARFIDMNQSRRNDMVRDL